ncbi:MAG: hypothetical protein AAF512_20995 [Pseudomonadota bacterium]
MKSWLPHLALLVAIIIAGYILLYASEPAQPVLTNIASEQVHDITLTRPGEPARVFHLDKRGGWGMKQPFELPARAFRLHQLTEITSTTSYAQFSVAGLNLADFGLQPAQATWRFNEIQLKFGNIERLSGQRYMQVGQTIHLTTDRFFHYGLKPATDFISLAILPPDSKLHELNLSTLHVKYSQGKWQILSDHAARLASADSISILINAWQNTQALDVLSYQSSSEEKFTVMLRLVEHHAPLIFKYSVNELGGLLTRPDIGVGYQLSKPQIEALQLSAFPA